MRSFTLLLAGFGLKIHTQRSCTQPLPKQSVFVFQMASVDVIAALDMFADKGEWDKCLQMAEQQVSAFSLSVICKQIFLKKNEEDAA